MKNKTTNDRAVTIRVTSAQFETVAKIAAENRTTVSALIGGFVESCVTIINVDDENVDLPQFLAVCRTARHYNKRKKPKIRT
tara:strand:- start:329 stop:574 length:246 start_codon:yes stop_codon:yes gene_type:complete